MSAAASFAIKRCRDDWDVSGFRTILEVGTRSSPRDLGLVTWAAVMARWTARDWTDFAARQEVGLFIAEECSMGAPIGCVGVVAEVSWPPSAWAPEIFGLHTDRGHRRSGVGRALLHNAIGFAAGKTGRGLVRLSVHQENIPARTLFESEQFEVAERRTPWIEMRLPLETRLARLERGAPARIERGISTACIWPADEEGRR